MKILEHDENIVAVIKDLGEDSEHDLPELIKNELGGEVYCLHRLDKNVGGVILFARNKKYAAIMSKAIQDNLFIKEYVTMVHGILDEKEGILEDLLFKDSRKNKVFVVNRERKGVKKAKLAYDVIREEENKSLVHVRLYTGRSHQIRVQFAHLKHPLIGDHKYGSRDEVKEPMLYSCKISFPYNKETKIVENYPEWY
ncbi:MAG: RNA pseudouridine synthase [Erysipelotrichaceae bacterium]|nr:RNA pseudouridine synthase [Erysipelotrichaceae bacterium]